MTEPGPLTGRRVVLGITGGIAAYKAVDVLRRLVEELKCRGPGGVTQGDGTQGEAVFVREAIIQYPGGRGCRAVP